MNKLGLVILLLCFFGIANAQKDPKAKEILDRMSSKYKSIPAFKANFVNKLQNKVEGIEEQFAGSIIVQGEKYMLSMSEQEIYNNGSTLWTYLKDANEVNIDDYTPDDGDMSPSNIYSSYQNGYKYRWVEEKQIGSWKIDVVELQPEKPDDPDMMFFKVILNIDQADNSIHSWMMYDRNGNVFSYTISGFNPGFQATDDMFEFNPAKHPDVEIVDLR
jgi:outer membrane lipoprotein-sorting protein